MGFDIIIISLVLIIYLPNDRAPAQRPTKTQYQTLCVEIKSTVFLSFTKLSLQTQFQMQFFHQLYLGDNKQYFALYGYRKQACVNIDMCSKYFGKRHVLSNISTKNKYKSELSLAPQISQEVRLTLLHSEQIASNFYQGLNCLIILLYSGEGGTPSGILSA